MPAIQLSHTFPPDLANAGPARRFVREAAVRLGLDEERAWVVTLLAHELVTNAVLHARTDVEVRVGAAEGGVRVEVHDGNTRLPQPCLVPHDATSGRGIPLVDAMATTWGTRRTADGKAVWFEVRPELTSAVAAEAGASGDASLAGPGGEASSW